VVGSVASAMDGAPGRAARARSFFFISSVFVIVIVSKLISHKKVLIYPLYAIRS
jgi:hypothetical protein